jgi:hypothetical protein
MAAEPAPAQQKAAEESRDALRLFRDAYFAFMDECQRLWQTHSRELHGLSVAASERLAKAVQQGSVEDANKTQTELGNEYRGRADKLTAELKKALQQYDRTMATAWAKAAEENLEESTLWHVGVAQGNVAWNYSAMLAALRG